MDDNKESIMGRELKTWAALAIAIFFVLVLCFFLWLSLQNTFINSRIQKQLEEVSPRDLLQEIQELKQKVATKKEIENILDKHEIELEKWKVKVDIEINKLKKELDRIKAKKKKGGCRGNTELGAVGRRIRFVGGSAGFSWEINCYGVQPFPRKKRRHLDSLFSEKQRLSWQVDQDG